jgi:secreted trypsin-like serine protease
MTRVQVLSNILLAAGLVCAVNAPALGETDTEMIVGGAPAEPGKYPWQVRLYESMDDEIGFCGGSIIDKQWILTAAHCLVDTDSVVVGFGDVDRTKTTKIESEKIFVHPDYADGKKADVALVKLAKPIPDAPAVSYAGGAATQGVLQPGARATVTGWGAVWDFQGFTEALDMERAIVSPSLLLTTDELLSPDQMRQAELSFITAAECRESYEAFGEAANGRGMEISRTEICAGAPEGARGSCFGDSGGPLLAPADTEQGYVQVGIVSWGVQCGNPSLPGVYARVAHFHDWIVQTMTEN